MRRLRSDPKYFDQGRPMGSEVLAWLKVAISPPSLYLSISPSFSPSMGSEVPAWLKIDFCPKAGLGSFDCSTQRCGSTTRSCGAARVCKSVCSKHGRSGQERKRSLDCRESAGAC